ncbi:MAG TPA: alcohol dehydrogenase catalytic domain-containing protein [Bryobacteraceae bacterium]|nr:alcohol dehydrogenase catalytic domain-containing protein [Bryobacteraceae bacterium]
MLAVHLESGRVELRRTALPRIQRGFARIRLLAAGICSTDLELQRGYYGFRGTPGHEFVGEVVGVNATNEDESKWMGRRVCGEINLACGHCEWCAHGLGRHCPTRTVLGIVKHPGAFREFLTLPIRNLHAVPRSIPDDHAVFIEPLAAACEILDQVSIPPGLPVAVLGDGKLGLLVAQVLQTHGARVHLFGRHREKLRLAEPSGVTTELVPKRLPKAAWPIVVDATGSSEGLRAAIHMCIPRGTVIMKSTVHGLVSIDTAPAIVNEVTLVGSRCGRFEPALRLLAKGAVNVSGMISETFALDQAPQAFATAATKGVLKVLLKPPD